MTRKTRRTIFLLVSLILVALVVFVNLKKEAIPVILHTVENGLVEASVANTRAGTVKACQRAKLAPTTGGQVANLYVKEGSLVEAGDLLLELWNEDLKAQLRLAESEAKAASQSAKEICLLAEVAAREAKRSVKLKKSNLTSAEEVDRIVTNAKAKQAGCEAAQSRTAVSVANADVARAALERTRLRAPFSGWVAEINAELGELVIPSPPGIPTPPAVDMVDNSCLYILAPIDEVDAPAILPGMEARISLDAFPGQNFIGAVRRIAPYVSEEEKQARTVDIEAVFMDENEYSQLLPGYSADVEVILDQRYDVVRVPTEAVLEDKFIFVFDPKDSLLEKREIEKGISNWKFTEVKSGLSAGEQIVMSIDREGLVDGALAVAEQVKP